MSGTFWCVVFGFTKSRHGRDRWMAINSFGLLLLFAGLTLIFGVAEFRRLMFAAGGAMVISLLVSLVAPALSRRDQKGRVKAL